MGRIFTRLAGNATVLDMGDRLLTRREVQRQVGLSGSAIYQGVKAGRFPSPIRVTDRAVRWPESEIIAWLETRPRWQVDAAEWRAQRRAAG